MDHGPPRTMAYDRPCHNSRQSITASLSHLTTTMGLPTSDEAAHLLGGELVDLNVVDESVAGTHHQSGLQIYASLSPSEDDGDVNRNYQQHPHIHNGHTERRSYDTHSLFSLLHKNIHLVLAYSIAALVAFIAIYHHYVPSSPNQHHHEAEPSEVANLPYFDLAYSLITNDPLSYKTPSDLGIPVYNDRPESSRPGSVFGSARRGSQIGIPLPTNEWYLNLLVGLDETPGSNNAYENFAGEENRVHTIPYILDTVGPIVGIRLHYPNVLSYGTVVQSVLVNTHGLTLGTADGGFTRRYRVDEKTLASTLGIGLRWNGGQNDAVHGSMKKKQRYMRSSILRGMSYGTMEYGRGVMPTLASEIVAKSPLIDGVTRMECGTLEPTEKQIHSTNSTKSFLVNEDVELYFPESDFTWLVFFSRPVLVQCYINPNKLIGAVSLPPGAVDTSSHDNNPSAFQLRANPIEAFTDMEADGEPLIVRIALANNCTTGTNVNFCNQNNARDQSAFRSLLRDHAEVYPTSPSVKYVFSDPVGGLRPESPDGRSAYLFFDWEARSYRGNATKELLMFALPHHIDILRLHGRSSNEVVGHCVHSLHGNTCLVKGGLWAMEEELGGLPSFTAKRPPSHLVIPALAKALSNDITYELPDNYMRGAGDTYFPGKMLAKLGRIIVIAQELRDLAKTPESDLPDKSTSGGDNLAKIIRKCKEVKLPTDEEMQNAVARLRSAVEIWLNGTAVAPFTYDNTWGGLVNCGCLFNGEGCDNIFPNCPSYQDPGLNFGNGFYNDHHFHYGYHIYAAAIVAQFDNDWGRRYFEHVLLFIRDIANPSINDVYFPVFRQKDWFLGNSWASGIALFGGRPYLNGRNQESSSEAIAAYEGVAMFGSVMMKAFGNGVSSSQSDNDNANTACQIFNIGRFLAATEIRSADRYWHVYSPKRHQIYPDTYTPAVVSMMWDTMCQLQTWFGSAPFLAYGIQLLPITPVSERRDTDQWLRQLYPSFVESCDSDPLCINEGWAVQLYAILASLGHPKLAMEKALALPESVFESAGGSGHSLSNTLWYIYSRPSPSVPYDLENPSTSINSLPVPKSEQKQAIDCGCPEICVGKALSSNANGFTCKERIQWLMTNLGVSELGACRQVAGIEFERECGPCNPKVCAGSEITDELDRDHQSTSASECPPCNVEVCTSKINKCQIGTAPYLCYEGHAMGGCAPTPWELDAYHCTACCELFKGCEG